MSTVMDPDQVDLVATGAEGRVVLIIIEPRLWGSDPQQVEQLRTKLNAYVAWIDSGGCAQAYPAARKHGIDILLQCLEDPSDEAAQLLMAARDGLAPRGIGVYYNIVTTDQPSS